MSYTQDELDRYAQVEQTWLRSVGANVTKIPDDVALAAFVRGYAERHPAQQLIEYIMSERLISQMKGE